MYNLSADHHAIPLGQWIKANASDALMIALCLSYDEYHALYIPMEEDAFVKEYLRMRDNYKRAKKTKQQIGDVCLRHGYHNYGIKWMGKHVAWLRKLELSPLYSDMLDEYMASYDENTEKIERFDKRIGKLASQKNYKERAKKLLL